jgi:hypothetical protein
VLAGVELQKDVLWKDGKPDARKCICFQKCTDRAVSPVGRNHRANAVEQSPPPHAGCFHDTGKNRCSSDWLL